MKKVAKIAILGLVPFALTACNIFGMGGDKTLSRQNFIEEGLGLMSKCTEAQLAVKTLTITKEKTIQGGEKEEIIYIATSEGGEWNYSNIPTGGTSVELVSLASQWETGSMYMQCKIMDGQYGADKMKDFTFKKLAAGGYTASGKSDEYKYDANGLLLSHKTFSTSYTTLVAYSF